MQNNHGTTGGIQISVVLLLVLLNIERNANLGNLGSLREDNSHSVIINGNVAHARGERNVEAVAAATVSAEVVGEGEVVSSVPVVLPSSEKRETGNNVELKTLGGDRERGGGDVANVITVVDIGGLEGEDLSDLHKC